MALTDSNMLPLGTLAPEFQLQDSVTDQIVRFPQDLKGKVCVLFFICNHCPYVIHVNDQLISIANDYKPKGIEFIAISSNDAVAYPDDAPEKMKENAIRLGYPFPYLIDETQEVAIAYQAACTPDIYVFDQEHLLVYRGRLDGSRPGNQIPSTGHDLRTALDALLMNQPISELQIPSAGCNIKWKKRKEDL